MTVLLVLAMFAIFLTIDYFYPKQNTPFCKWLQQSASATQPHRG